MAKETSAPSAGCIDGSGNSPKPKAPDIGALYLTDLGAVLRSAGLNVIEVGSSPSTTGTAWQHRARSTGGYEPGRPNHVLVHHTASGPSSDGWGDVNYLTFTHQYRPVSNLYLGRTGTVWTIAGGAANTNGTGHDTCGVTPDDSMNTHAIAIEAGNTGVGEPWPVVMQDAYERTVRALCGRYAIPVGRIHAHFEWAPTRKIDPAGPSRWSAPTGGGSANMWDLDAFRGSVATGGISTEPFTEADARMAALATWTA